jgi:hypothetical protein
MTKSTIAAPVRVFLSYRHANHSVRDEVRKHLGWLENSDKIRVFDDRDILAGDDWDARIKAELEQAQIIILIVTADFMHSPYCTKVELKNALERRASEGTRVIPIIAETCDWEAMPIFQIAALPKDKANNLKPLNKWRGDKDIALTQIAQQVRRNVGKLTAITDQQPSSSLAAHNLPPSNSDLIGREEPPLLPGSTGHDVVPEHPSFPAATPQSATRASREQPTVATNRASPSPWLIGALALVALVAIAAIGLVASGGRNVTATDGSSAVGGDVTNSHIKAGGAKP